MSQVKEVESKFDKYHFIHTIPGEISVKKILVQMFPSFVGIDHTGRFRENLTAFSNLAGFLGTIPTCFKNLS